jgi:hypothetical protein
MLQCESLNFTQSDGRDTTLTVHGDLQRRQLLEYELSVFCASNSQLYPMAYSVTGLYGSTRIETNIYCNRPATWHVYKTLSVAVKVMALPIWKHLFI